MSKERCIIDCDILKVSAMINFASSKYFVVSARMVSPFFGSLLTAVASRYPKSCRNDSASTSLKVWRRSTIHSTMSLWSVFEFTFGLQLVIVCWLLGASPLDVILCLTLRCSAALLVVRTEYVTGCVWGHKLQHHRSGWPGDPLILVPWFQIHDVSMFVDLADDVLPTVMLGWLFDEDVSFWDNVLIRIGGMVTCDAWFLQWEGWSMAY